MKTANVSDFIAYSDDSFTKRIIFKEADSVVFVLNFRPGQALPPHKHPGAQVYLLVLKGNGTVTVDGTDAAASEGDAIQCEDQELLAIRNTGSEPMSVYVCLNKIPDDRYARPL